MTIEQARAKLLAWISAEVGYHEGSNNFNKYAALANIERLYGGRIQNAPWCDVFTDAAFVTVFGLKLGAAMTYQTVGNGSALCRDSAQYFKEHGAFFKKPEPGDVIFFFRAGEINHQGIVIRVIGGSVITVEGNSSDSVTERCYSISDSSIAGYGRPRWELAAETIMDAAAPEMADSASEEPKEAESGFTLAPPTLRAGMGGDWVAALQGVLVFRHYNLGPYGTGGVDGDFGMMTLEAVRNFQTRHGLAVDGVAGPQTWAAMLGRE